MEEIFETQMTAQDLATDPRITSLVANNSIFRTQSHPGFAFTVKEFDVSTKLTTNDIYLFYPEGHRVSKLTRNAKGTSSYEPDFAISSSNEIFESSILFIRGSQIWQIPLAGGEAHRVSSFKLPVETYRFFLGQDEQPYVAVVFNVYANASLSETVRIDNEIANSGTSGALFNKLMVRHWDNWGTYKKRHHIFICKLDITSEGLLLVNESNMVDIMFGLETDCPGKGPGQGREEFSISPDGRYVTFASRRTAVEGTQSRDFSWSTSVAIYLYDLSNLQQGLPADVESLVEISDPLSNYCQTQPVFSPEGSKVAYLAMTTPQYESDKLDVMIYCLKSKSRHRVTSSVDLSFTNIDWYSNSEMIVTAQYRASNKIFHLTLTNNYEIESLKILMTQESRTFPLVLKLSNYKILAYLESSLTKPNEIKYTNITNLDEAFSIFNPNFLVKGEVKIASSSVVKLEREVFSLTSKYTNGDVVMPEYTEHYFEGGEGDLVHCWYLPPVGLDVIENRSFPLLLIVHGGPQSAILNTWSYRWNMALMASQGYGVVAVNFHGSTGFGKKFSDSIRGDWGGKPFVDCIKCVEYILDTYPYLDSTRLAALGASYGGYMMNWINGHTDKFKCLVNHDGIFSLKGLYFATDEQWFPEWEFGLPWENEDVYKKWSPDTYVNQWKTPTLVIQGGVDYRVCETESISTFTALQRLGIDSQMLFFPEENHWVLRPLNSIKWHETVFAWLKKYLK